MATSDRAPKHGAVNLKDYIRDVPDFPNPGTLFKDITPLLLDPLAFRVAVDAIADYVSTLEFDAIVSIDARGFLLAGPLAYLMNKPLIPVRKKGKLPFKTHELTYQLEYGSDTLEIHVDAVAGGHSVLIVDDLLATGGTVAAAAGLVEQMDGRVAGVAVLVELTRLNGRAQLHGYDIHSIVRF